MQFKIDTKPTYHIISTDFDLFNAKMAEECSTLIQSLKNNDNSNFIIDLSSVNDIENNLGEDLIALNDSVYHEYNGSLVFTNLQEAVLKKLKQKQIHLSINITPTLIEAVDIISMEVLERDLLDEQ